MNKAARAVIIENNNVLVMQRNKQGMVYYTLVGGKVSSSETSEQAVVREVREETGLEITSSRLVFTEKHPAPYNSQDIYLCSVAPHGPIGLTIGSEEELLGRQGLNTHTPYWVPIKHFERLHFRTPGLHVALIKALKKGFPKTPEAV